MNRRNSQDLEEIIVCSYTETATPFTKRFCEMDIVFVEQSKALKKPLRVTQSNSCGIDCHNFAVVSTATNSCRALLQQGTIIVLHVEVQGSLEVERITAFSR